MRAGYLSRSLRSLHGVRWVRTLRGGAGGNVPQFLDIESQLADYTDEYKREVLEQLRELKPLDPTKRLSTTQYHAAIVRDYLQAMDEGTVAIQDETFWRLVRVLAKLGLESRSAELIDLFVELFERAKLIESASLREAMIFEVGRYIYRQKRVRFDVVNEVEYLDSLVANRRAFQALKLWRSRASREEVKGSTFWSEVGVLYYLDARLLSRAHTLAKQLLKESPDDTPTRVVVALINAWAQQLNRGNQSAIAPLEEWVAVLLRTPVSDTNVQDFERALHALLSSRQWESSREILEKIPLKVWDNEDNVAMVSRALLMSASSKAAESPQNDFLILFESMLTKIQDISLNPVLSGSLTLHFARNKDVTATRELLADLRARNLEFPVIFQKHIARQLVRAGGRIVVDEWLNEPEGFAEILRLIDQREAAELAQQYMDADGKVSASLAYRILRLQWRLGYSFLQDSQVLKLGVNSVCQEFIWYLSATQRLKLSPDEIMKQPWRPVSEQSIIYICQAFFNHYAPDYNLASTRMFEGLNLVEDATPVKVMLLLTTIRKLVEGRRVPMLVPKPRRHREQVGASLGSWNDAIERAQAVIPEQRD